MSLNLFSMLFLFPAMMALDVRRLFAARYDIFCCLGRDSGATNAAILHNAKNEKVGLFLMKTIVLQKNLRNFYFSFKVFTIAHYAKLKPLLQTET